VPFKDHIFWRDFVNVLQFVSQAGAASGLDTQSHANALAALAQVTVNVPGGSFSQGNSHDQVS
jgi:hypothetical protein